MDRDARRLMVVLRPLKVVINNFGINIHFISFDSFFNPLSSQVNPRKSLSPPTPSAPKWENTLFSPLKCVTLREMTSEKRIWLVIAVFLLPMFVFRESLRRIFINRNIYNVGKMVEKKWGGEILFLKHTLFPFETSPYPLSPSSPFFPPQIVRLRHGPTIKLVEVKKEGDNIVELIVESVDEVSGGFVVLLMELWLLLVVVSFSFSHFLIFSFFYSYLFQ